MKALLITIDGPSGAGKTTVSRRLAERLGYTYVDTGALYRAVAWVALSRGLDVDDESLSQVCDNLALEFRRGPAGPRLHANGQDVTDRLRTPQITAMASAVSARPVVRTYLLGVQRGLAKGGGVVFEGRDMGTVVFPEADIKFFLDAQPEIRARRRYSEFVEKNQVVTLPEVGEAMKKRDKDDSTRALAPLKPAADAIIIDSSRIGIQEVVETMIAHIGRFWDPPRLGTP